MKEITRQWLDFAKSDLLSCELIIKEDSLTNVVAFHSQQAVEKSFKAILEENELKLERIHNLYKLFSKVEPCLNFEVDINLLELLDKIYSASRYPGDLGLLPEGKPTQEEAKEMFEFAECVFNRTNKMLSRTSK